MRQRPKLGSILVLVLCWAAGATQPARAQSVTAGEVLGSVRDPAGAILGGAVVTLSDSATGFARTVATTRGGRYRLALVPPGEYQALFEHLGYRPVRVVGVLVRCGTTADVTVALAPEVPPVSQVDTVRYAAGAAIAAGRGEWLSPVAMRLLPDAGGALTDLGRLSTIVTSDLASEGLPGWLSGILLDGVPYRPARHPGLPGGQFDAGALRLSTFDQAELVTNGADVEWSGFGGATLSGFRREGTSRVEPHFYLDGTGDAISSSKYFDTGATPNSSFRGARRPMP